MPYYMESLLSFLCFELTVIIIGLKRAKLQAFTWDAETGTRKQLLGCLSARLMLESTSGAAKLSCVSFYRTLEYRFELICNVYSFNTGS